jgi:hypothetical protein
MNTQTCRGCDGNRVQRLIEFGPQPPSNRFERNVSAVTERHHLSFGQCTACGLFQLIDPMPPEMVACRHNWLTYNEPEGHLDDVAERVLGLSGINPSSRIVGLTYKDDSLLLRLNRLGFNNTYRYNLASDLGILDACAGLETIQKVISPELIDVLNEKHGLADIVIVRHVIEHAHIPAKLLASLSRLLAPYGRLILEMPNCQNFINACDHSFLWEEHITYFSPHTLNVFLNRNRLRTEITAVYPYPLEDSLVVVASSAGEKTQDTLEFLDADLNNGRRFARNFEWARRTLRCKLEAVRGVGNRVALFGASHLAVKFLNLYGLVDCIDVVIDDNPNKQGLSMPGSGLPIIGSTAMNDYQLCLLALNPESEQRVLAMHENYVAKGGRFASIFTLSPIAFLRT